LITYLLLKEKTQEGTVALVKFYQRRILRIWPVYYLVVIAAFFLIPKLGFLPYALSVEEHFYSKLALFLSILPNGALALYPGINFASLSWSVGVEEQFYLIWPLLINGTRNYARTMLYFIGCLIGLKVLLFLAIHSSKEIPHLSVIKEFLVMTRLECMAIGGLAALLLYNPQYGVNRFIIRRELQIVVLVVLVPLTYLIYNSVLDDLKHIFYSILFAILILNTASGRDSIINFDMGILNKLGRISYGFYMYQYFVIIPVLHMIKPLFQTASSHFWVNAVYYGISLTILIFVSKVSYDLYESWFIKRKKRYSVVESTN
jgi:peptidoglycan/LPS O-acetylase OafA/YrhL